MSWLEKCFGCFSGDGSDGPDFDESAPNNQAALENLRTAPEDFLWHNYVQARWGITATGLWQVVFGEMASVRKGRESSFGFIDGIPGTGELTAEGRKLGMLRPDSAPIMLTVFGVETLQAAEVDLAALPVNPIPIGCDFICTAKLSGCCIVYLPFSPEDGLGPYLAHINPPSGGGMGVALERDLAQFARFAGCARKPICFGRSQYEPPLEANVVGVFNGGWSLWVQLIKPESTGIEDVQSIG